jgi:hypothetical protein
MALVALPGGIVLSVSNGALQQAFQLISWSHIEILAVASLEPQGRSRPCCKPDLHPTAERAQAARRRNNTHQAPTANVPPPPSPTTTKVTDTAPITSPPPSPPPHAAVPPLPLVSLLRAPPVSLPSAQRPWCPRMCLPSYTLLYPGLSLACAKTTPTPTAILIIYPNILAARTSAKQIACFQTTAQSHCQHPSTSPSVRAGCESRTFPRVLYHAIHSFTRRTTTSDTDT